MTSVLSPLRISYAPALEPPYDDEYLDHNPALDVWRYLVLQPQLPGLIPSHHSVAPAPRPVDPPRWELTTFGRLRTQRKDLPEPEGHARKLVQAFMEVIAGRRPIEQLVSWLHEKLYFELLEQYGQRQRCAAGKATDRMPARQPGVLVTRVRCCEPSDGIAEASAVVRERDRAFAVALRLEGLDGSWRCTSLTLV